MRTRTRITLAGLALGAALAGGVAWATIPADSGLYTACKLKATGTIRLIDPAGPSSSLLSRCTTYETQITWNQKGLKGDPGTAGVNGTSGAAGNDGAPGSNGTDGVKGDAGPAGANGADGKDGTNGTNGTDGAKGDKGDPGEAGATGPAGVATTHTTRLSSSNGGPATVHCLAGEQVTGGGAFGNGVGAVVSFPVDASGDTLFGQGSSARGWQALRAPQSTFVTAYVFCAATG